MSCVSVRRIEFDRVRVELEAELSLLSDVFLSFFILLLLLLLYSSFFFRCDSTSAVYSYSFMQRVFSSTNADRDEVLGYLEDAACKYGVLDRFFGNTQAVSAVWDEEEKVWKVTIKSAEGAETERKARILVNAPGGFSQPQKPRIPGLESFRGEVVHTAEWDRERHFVESKKVGIIGTGCSGIQLFSAICEKPGTEVVLFQRSPFAALPLEYKLYSAEEMEEFYKDPKKLSEVREQKLSLFEVLFSSAFVGNPMIDGGFPWETTRASRRVQGRGI